MSTHQLLLIVVASNLVSIGGQLIAAIAWLCCRERRFDMGVRVSEPCHHLGFRRGEIVAAARVELERRDRRTALRPEASRDA